MKKLLILLTFLTASISLTGCSGAFWGGAGAGALGAGAGYEYNAHKQMQQLDADLAAGRINQQEYNIRKDQIQKGSLIK
jgi:hypothetical protein